MCSKTRSGKHPGACQPSGCAATAYLSILFLLSIGLLAPSPAAGQRTAHLSGQVVTDRGQPIKSGVMIILETETGDRAAETPAHSDGSFDIPSVKKMSYRLVVTAEGFETWQQTIDLGYGASQYVIKITLTPLNRVKESAVAAPALTDDQAPKTARKEYEKGSRALAARQLDAAYKHLENAVAEFPCYARAQADLAVVLTERHELPSAEAALRKAVQCDPGFPDAYTQLGQLLNAERKFAESVALLQDGLRRSPNAWQFYYQLAIAHFSLKQYSQAEEEYMKVQSFNPKPPAELHVKLADLYLKENAYTKAYTQMQAYLQAEPQGRFAAKIKTIMQQMESSGTLRTAANEPPAP